MIIYIPQVDVADVEDFRDLIKNYADSKLPEYPVPDILSQIDEQTPKRARLVDIEELVKKYTNLHAK